VVTSAIGEIALVMRNERSFTPPSRHASSASGSLFPRPFSMSSSDSVGEIGGRGTDSSLCGDSGLLGINRDGPGMFSGRGPGYNDLLSFLKDLF
jgi:hypothetical protein